MKLCFLAAFLLLLQISGAAQAPAVRSCGVKILVSDLGKARDFYCNTLGFGVLKEDKKEKTLWLDTKEDRQVVLQQHKKKLLPNAGDKTCISFTLQVNNLDSAQARLRARGVRFVQDQKRAEGVGFSLHYYDPFGNVFSLLEQTLSKTAPFAEPKLYNYGYYISDLPKQEDFFLKMGFVERTKKYLPGDMPLYHADKSFGFMLHLNREQWGNRDFSKKGTPAARLLFQSDDLEKLALWGKQNGFSNVKKQNGNASPGALFWNDSFGNTIEIVLKAN
jgi:catechol 2,3-dioxygenase-like lactoylglutathione lyase family enzyme